MSIGALSIARVSSLLQADSASQAIDNTQAELQKVQEELSTGLAVNEPSDNPASAAVIMQLNKTLSRQSLYSDNINSASSQLGQVDSALGTLQDLLRQAQTVASSAVGSDVTSAQRASDATVIQSIYTQALQIGNQSFNGSYLFGGAAAQKPPFIQANGGVQFIGSPTTLTNRYGDSTSLAFQVDGAQVFGALSAQVTGSTNLSPSLTAATRIVDVGGTLDTGVKLGPIQISDGTVSKTVDLSAANSIGDVVNLINQAGVGSVTASISGNGLTLSGTGSENITVSDIGGGATAAALGIATPAAGEGTGVPVTGANINPQVTDLTPLSALRNGLGIDSSGLQITNGTTTKTIVWPAGGTVQDMLNAINGAALGVKASINSSGTGINIVNTTEGINMSVGENGGSTATELGVRSFTGATPLSQLNNGLGVQTAGGTTPDFQITRQNGTTFTVALGSAQTVQDVVNAINAADGGGGVTAGLAATGNGIVLSDSTSGSSTLAVTPLNYSTAAAQLGLTTPATGNTINGKDTNGISTNGIFGNLQALISALQTNNQPAITNAAGGIQNDLDRVTTIQGQTGATEQAMQNMQTTLTNETTTTQSLISTLQDANYTDVITQYTTLQTTLQASLESTAKTLGLSLLNFLQ
jgi:flagellar hook-associated protein 3 FlgL